MIVWSDNIYIPFDDKEIKIEEIPKNEGMIAKYRAKVTDTRYDVVAALGTLGIEDEDIYIADSYTGFGKDPAEAYQQCKLLYYRDFSAKLSEITYKIEHMFATIEKMEHDAILLLMDAEDNVKYLTSKP